MKKAFTLSLLIAFFSVCYDVNAQSTPNPCDFDKIICGVSDKNTLLTSFDSDTIIYAPPGRSMPFWFAFGDSSSKIIDTTGSFTFNLSLLSGPGTLLGNPSTSNGYFSYLENISFSNIGTYVVSINVGGYSGAEMEELVFVVPPEVDFCSEVPGGECVGEGGDAIFAKPQFSNVIPVDAVIPIKVGVINSNSGNLDSNFVGTIYVEQISGPGQLYGTLSMTGEKWFNFINLQFSAEGLYEIRFFENEYNIYKEALLDIEVIQGPNGSRVAAINGFDLFPNPIENQFTFSSQKDLLGSLIEIYNYSGQRVFLKKISTSGNKHIINTELLPKGVYLLKVSDKNKIYSLTKIIK